ncbi:MAG TPA: PrsW family glutamic-type intramembrane protease [Thermoanaerobaculia bacterium]|nr:PrsW family glutamic-type intramembrane protease [Thermoanaerobaculia bacterium]
MPVLSFLGVLVLLDSYKLVRLGTIVGLVLAGALVAVACRLLHDGILLGTPVSRAVLTRYVAPVTEEALKGLLVFVLIRRHRVAFLVDASICGFAVGAGFATVENIQYFVRLEDPSLGLWMVRGFGTAIMHGGMTAIQALCARDLVDRRGRADLVAYLGGLAPAAALHSLYNHFLLPPMLSTLVVLYGLPAIFTLVFVVSERRTRRWLGVGFDSDADLLRAMDEGQLGETPIGRYVVSLKEHFPREALADMLCLIRLHLELSVEAKGLLLAREAGFDLEPSEDAPAKLREMKHLEHSIGATGKLALRPIFSMSSRDLWQLYLLGGETAGPAAPT